jgi:hypothetical protein
MENLIKRKETKNRHIQGHINKRNKEISDGFEIFIGFMRNKKKKIQDLEALRLSLLRAQTHEEFDKIKQDGHYLEITKEKLEITPCNQDYFEKLKVI